MIFEGAHHSIFYPQMQPGRRAFDHWLEYNDEAARSASRHLRQFLDQHVT